MWSFYSIARQDWKVGWTSVPYIFGFTEFERAEVSNLNKMIRRESRETLFIYPGRDDFPSA